MQRTGISDGIDILQIHWQDYSSPTQYLELFRQLVQLREMRKVRIDVIGLVNFDTVRVREICEAVGKGEVKTNQIQVSPTVLFLFISSVFRVFVSWLALFESGREDEEDAEDEEE